MSRVLYRLARLCVRRRRLVLATWLLIAVGVLAAGVASGGSPSSEFTIPGAESQEAADLLADRYADKSGSTVMAVVAAPEGERLLARIGSLRDYTERLAGIDGVVEVTDLSNRWDVEGRVSDDGTVMFFEVDFAADREDLGHGQLRALEAAAAPLRTEGFATAFGGDLSSEPEEPASEMIGLGIAVVVLLVAFGSLVAVGLPLLVALVSLAIGMGAILIAASALPVSEFAPMLAGMIGLAVGIDYALFIVTRHRQLLSGGLAPEEAAAQATATAGSAVLVAGATVVVAISGLAIAGIPMITTMGLASSAVVGLSVAVSLTLLPAMLGFAGRRIDSWAVPGLRRRVRAESGANSLSARWARRVTRRPLPWLLASLAFLLVLAAPLASLRLGMTDAGNDPPGSTTRRAYDLLADAFGRGFNGPLVLVMDLASVANAERRTAINHVTNLVEATPGVDEAFSGMTNRPGDVAIVIAMPSSPPQAAATSRLVHHLRDEVIPPAVAPAAYAEGAQVYVTGTAAGHVDMSDLLARRLPLFVGVVVLLSFLLLVMLFRSVVVPLKAAVANLLSIGAAYGVVVAVFQWGWAGSLLGLSEPLPIISFLPMMVFAILFGLSMDYEVFILSRVREEWVRTGDGHGSVVSGIASSARVITAAALIMVSLFGSFVLAHDPVTKMFGLGLSVAVLLDVTVVRMVFVPAAMALLGDRNWWLPKWLSWLGTRHVEPEVTQLVGVDGGGRPRERIGAGLGLGEGDHLA